MNLKFGCLAMFSVTGLVLPGLSQPVQWTQIGTVNSAVGSAWNALSAGGINPGTPFTLNLTYDPTTPASPAASGSYPGAIVSGSLSLADISFQFDLVNPDSASRIDVVNTYTSVFNGAEGYFWFLYSSAAQHGLDNLTLEGHLFSSDASLFPSADLDIQRLAISEFDLAHNVSFSGLDRQNGISDMLDLTVTGYSLSSVPEPGVGALLAAAMLVVLARKVVSRPRDRR